jgi:hypothetical protein
MGPKTGVIAMNLNDIDLVALQRDLEEYARQQRERGWLRRNWLWFVPMLLLVLVLLGGGALYWGMFIRIYQLDIFQSAMQQIEADQAVQGALGQPITKAGWPPPSARLEAGEQDIRWSIKGSKTDAKAHVAARFMQGKWEIVQLEVLLTDGKRLSVASSGDSEANAPVFSAPKAASEKTEPEKNSPPPEINLALPPDDGPGK